MKCGLCNKEITPREAHNGEPLIKGPVCGDCNWKVIRERLKRARSQPSSTESIAVTGTDGPVNTTDPMADFEKYAKQFEETFILGKTPVRKERPENKMKVKDGDLVGEIDSMDKPEKMEQVDPEKSATEGLKTWGELEELVKLCKEIGLETLGDLSRFLKENPGVDTLTALREYRKELGDDFKIKD